MHMMEQTPEAEAGSHRSSGHRIENAPLIEYQMSPFTPASCHTVARWRDKYPIASKRSPMNRRIFSHSALAAVFAQVR